MPFWIENDCWKWIFLLIFGILKNSGSIWWMFFLKTLFRKIFFHLFRYIDIRTEYALMAEQEDALVSKTSSSNRIRVQISVGAWVFKNLVQKNIFRFFQVYWYLISIRSHGGTGRRSGLKIRFEQSSLGSNPSGSIYISFFKKCLAFLQGIFIFAFFLFSFFFQHIKNATH